MIGLSLQICDDGNDLVWYIVILLLFFDLPCIDLVSVVAHPIIPLSQIRRFLLVSNFIESFDSVAKTSLVIRSLRDWIKIVTHLLHHLYLRLSRFTLFRFSLLLLLFQEFLWQLSLISQQCFIFLRLPSLALLSFALNLFLRFLLLLLKHFASDILFLFDALISFPVILHEDNHDVFGQFFDIVDTACSSFCAFLFAIAASILGQGFIGAFFRWKYSRIVVLAIFGV